MFSSLSFSHPIPSPPSSWWSGSIHPSCTVGPPASYEGGMQKTRPLSAPRSNLCHILSPYIGFQAPVEVDATVQVVIDCIWKCPSSMAGHPTALPEESPTIHLPPLHLIPFSTVLIAQPEGIKSAFRTHDDLPGRNKEQCIQKERKKSEITTCWSSTLSAAPRF